jgi:hypothetical protein
MFRIKFNSSFKARVRSGSSTPPPTGETRTDFLDGAVPRRIATTVHYGLTYGSSFLASPRMDTGGVQNLRILVVTENFLPKVDGVTRTLARLLEHLQREGHDVLLLGPDSNL